jgi:hypothetical protein
MRHQDVDDATYVIDDVVVHHDVDDVDDADDVDDVDDADDADDAPAAAAPDDALGGLAEQAMQTAGAPVTTESLGAVRAAAAAIVDQATPNDIAGLKDYHKLTIAIGMRAVHVTFNAMVAAAQAEAKKADGSGGLAAGLLADAEREIVSMSPVTETGCMKVDFFNRTTSRSDVAYLVLDRCGRDHDLGAQLDPLRAAVAPDRWGEVVKHLSMLVFLGRTVYKRLAGEHVGLIRRLFGAEKYPELLVDPVNTTLYVEAEWLDRVGIYVRYESDVGCDA